MTDSAAEKTEFQVASVPAVEEWIYVIRGRQVMLDEDYEPYVFTEQGVAMLSGVLRSDRAIVVNIEIMRAFVELRRAASQYEAPHRVQGSRG